MAYLVQEAKQIASSAPKNCYHFPTKAATRKSGADISKLCQLRRSVDDGTASMNDQTNM